MVIHNDNNNDDGNDNDNDNYNIAENFLPQIIKIS